MGGGVVEYQARAFEVDASVLRAAGGNRISLVSLLDEGAAGGGLIGDHARAFRSFARRDWFLWCFFFDALLDQAIHTAGRSTHATFDRPQSIKLVGILASYHMNLHPAMLLLASSLMCSGDRESAAVLEFKDLTVSEMGRYSRVLSDSAGQLREEARRVFAEMSNGMALLNLPRGFASFSMRQPNLRIYDQWTRAVADAINERCRWPGRGV